MQCTYCAAPLPPNSLVCAYCGQRNAVNLRTFSIQKLDSEEKINCPVCETQLGRMDIGLKEKMIVHHCDTCDGLFIQSHHLQKSIDNIGKNVTTINPKIIRFVLDNPRQEKQKERFYRRCPYCNIMMQRINYRAVSGVIIDQCSQHGIWLDGGELHQIFEWKKVGGEIKIQNYQRLAPLSIGSYQSNKYFPDPIEDFFRWLMGL
ncbi:MAG: zf-TFIIB domain-containing protein [Campylobacterota bacterium]|nr:zf-TFIIB domain-containing protein [Campylobacterota bacterium]